MSTEAIIGRLNADKTVTFTRINWDGYPSHTGRMLLEHYSDQEKVDGLMALGELSSIRPLLNPTGPHSFENPQKDVSVFYGRDRGEEDVGSETVNDLSTFADHSTGYTYAFIKGVWYILKIGKDDTIRKYRLTLKNTERKV